MGIFGLTGFIDKNTHLLHKHELKDSPVVIDGNNLFHYIYQSYGIKSLLGGDFDVYRSKIVVNFKSLLRCRVKPFVVLDGGYTTDNRKFSKCVRKAKQRIRNAQIASQKSKCSMTPLLAYDTFIQVLNELNIPHVTCQFEADNEIAKLANKLKCPVISKDSDFYIFDLIHGFLPLDYIDFNPLHRKNEDGSESTFLYCRKYHIEDFISSFKGLSRSVLPVFASLLGNDYVSPIFIRNVYSQAQITVPEACVNIRAPNSLAKVLQLLRWLERNNKDNKDSDNLLENILPLVKSKKKFLTSVLSYYDVVNFEGCDLQTFFSCKKKDFVPNAEPHFSGYNGASFPSWFLLSICKGEITPPIMNAAVLHRTFLLCQAEHLPSPTAYRCSECVRKVTYGILFQNDPVDENYRRPLEQDSRDYLTELCQANIQRINYGRVAGEEENDNSNRDVTDENKDIVTVTDITVEPELETGGEVNPSANDASDGGYSDNDDKECMTTKIAVNRNSDGEKDNGEEVDDDNAEEKEEVLSDVEEPDASDLASSVPVDVSVLKRTRFEEYQRDKSSLKKVYLEPTLSINEEPLPSLSDLADLPKEKRLLILLSAVGADSSFVHTFSPDILLYVLCLCMWIRNANPPVTEQHLDCAILCPILLHMHNAAARKKKSRKRECQEELEAEDENSQTRIDLVQVCENYCSSYKFMKIIENLDRYHSTKPRFDMRNKFDIEITHPYVQLQCCMYDASNLNKLLRFPIPNIKPASLMNGTFLYNFYVDLLSRPEPDAFIEAMLLKGSDIHNLFLQIKRVVTNAVAKTVFASFRGDVKKRKKKSKGRRKKKIVMSERDEGKELGSNSNSNCEEDDKEMVRLDGFDINNRFSMLCV